MKILLLFTTPLFPLNTGAKIRTFNLLKGVSRQHEITYAAFANSAEDTENLMKISPYCHKVLRLQSQRFSSIRLVNLLFKNIFSEFPLTIQKYWSSKAYRAIEKELAKEKYDLIHCDQPHMAPYIENVDRIPKLLNEHNIEANLLKRYGDSVRNIIRKKILYWQCRKMQNYETKLWRNFNCVTVVSSIDQKSLLEKEPAARVVEIQNGVDTEYFKPNGLPEEPHCVVFTGSMDWKPNEDSVLYFCNEIWGKVKSEFPDSTFYIVGRNPGKKIMDLNMKNGIVVTGTVNDVRSWLEKSAVVVVPLRIGGGSRLKILEALSMKKTVISTTIGCEGLEVTPGEDIQIADEPDEFAAKIIRHFEAGENNQILGENGRRMVVQRYDWTIIAEKLNDVYNSIIDSCN